MPDELRDVEDAPIGGGFQNVEEIIDALPPFLKD